MSQNTSIENLYPALTECFSIIICGYFAGRMNYISETEAKGINTFVGTFALPSLIFMSLAELDLVAVNWTFLLAILIAKAAVFACVIIVVVLIRRPVNLGRAGIFAIFCTQSNDFAIGYPIVAALYADTHPEYASYLYLMAPISLALLNPISFVLIEIGRRRGDGEQSLSQSPTTTTTTTTPARVFETTQSPYLVLSVAKAIASNPIICMTVLGVVGNVIFGHHVPIYLGGTLKVLGSAFSASALFLLGLRMVGKVSTLRGPTLILPGLLIITKLLVLPLVTREVVSLLQPGGSNTSQTLDLSTYGFLYGTFPAAPTVFVFASQYGIDVDLIASAMVACTFISAPWMFISAEMISMSSSTDSKDFLHKLNLFTFDISIVGCVACCVVALSLLFSRRLLRYPHKCVGFLLISQFAACAGAILGYFVARSNVVSWLSYVQFALFTAGVFSARIWTALLAVTLLFLQCKSLCFVLKLQPVFLMLGYGVPVLLSAALILFDNNNLLPYDKRNPNFVYGVFQAIVAVTLLVLCFIVTVGCLILQQRHRKRHERYWTLACDVASSFNPQDPLLYDDNDINEQSDEIVHAHDLLKQGKIEEAEQQERNNLLKGGRVKTTTVICPVGYNVQPSNSSGCSDCPGGSSGACCSSLNVAGPPLPTICETYSTPIIPDIEDLQFASKRQRTRTRTVSSSSCGPADRERCEAAARAADMAAIDDRLDPIERAAETETDEHDMQTLRHIVLVILLLCSVFVGLAMSIWTLLTGGGNSIFPPNNGIYIELAFLDSALNSGQSLIVFAVFGLQWRGAILAIAARWRHLTNKTKLSSSQSEDDKRTCAQFRRYHLARCRAEIVSDKQGDGSRVYKSVFTGSDLIGWLVGVGLAEDKAAALTYGRRMVRGRVVRHWRSGAHDLYDHTGMLYMFLDDDDDEHDS